MLETLKEEDQPIPIKQFAENFEVSVRTIQNDINNIDYLLQANHLPILKRWYKGSVSLEEDDGRLINLLNFLSGIETKDVVLRPKERLHALYMLLLKQQGYITIAGLCEQLGVSKGTVLNDLKRLRKKIQTLPFDIGSNSRYGIKLVGNEKAIREFAINSYMEHTDISCIYNISDYYAASICNEFCKTRSLEDTRCIFEQIRNAEGMIDKKLTDRSFLLVIAGVELDIDRIRNNKMITMDLQKLGSLFETTEFKAAHCLTDNLSRIFNIQFPLEETVNIATQLLGCNDINMNFPESCENYAEIQLVVCRLIQDVGNSLDIDFSGSISLYNDLVHQIRPVIHRVKNTITLKNPLLKDIKKHYLSVFNAVKQSVENIERLANAKLPEDEIGYICTHFASIIERESHTEKIRPNVLIVCDSGVGTCNLLSARLTSMYEVNIVDKIAYCELESALHTQNVDYILTTIDIKHNQIRVFQVSPIINEKDENLLDLYFQRRLNRVIDFDRLMKILENNCVIRDKNQLIQELSENYSLIIGKREKKGDDKMLKDVIDERMIRIDFSASDWKEAVREAGNLLINGDCVDKRYVDNMINVVKSIGAYIVIGKGIALPHSRSAEGVNKIGISFLRLTAPVNFGHPENDPVDLLFGLASIDNKSHIRALKDLTKILSDNEKVKKLRKVKTTDEVFSILAEGEEDV